VLTVNDAAPSIVLVKVRAPPPVLTKISLEPGSTSAVAAFSLAPNAALVAVPLPNVMAPP